MRNDNLLRARATRDDEFYTPYALVDDELSHYTSDLTGRRILCDCSDMIDGKPRAFAAWFADHYHDLHLRSLTVLEYHEPDLFDQRAHGVRWDYDGEQWKATNLRGSGGFDTPEAMTIRRASDVVVSNPPFSLWGQWLECQIRDQVRFLALGPIAATGYTPTVRLLRQKRIWWGCTLLHGGAAFDRPDGTTASAPAVWFTDLSSARQVRLPLEHIPYDPEAWDTLDGDPTILFSPGASPIPDIDRTIGVPYSFIGRWDPDAYDILGKVDPVIDGERKFRRLLIRRRPRA